MGPLRDATQLMEMDLSKPISRGGGHDLARPRGETSWALRGPNPVKLVEMLRAKGPKSGIVATTKRYGPLGPYGAILRRKNLSHHGVGLVASAGESAQDPGGYGYNDYASYDGYGYNDYDHYGYEDGYGYDGYDESGGIGDESGGYDSYAGEDVGAIPPELGPPAPGEAEALKEEQETQAVKECMAKCPVWDPLATAKPEDLQHASLVVLQRLARPEHRLTPSLRRASAAVDAAGRSLERWVRKRQDLARELPKLQQIMTQCKSLQDERDAEQLDDDLQAISAKTKLARQQAEAKKEETELAQESMVMQDVGHMQGKADRWALNQAMQEQDRRDAMENSKVTRAVNGYNQQGADFQQRQMEEVQKEMSHLSSSSLQIKDTNLSEDGSSAGAPKVSTSMTLAQNVGVEAANEATGPSHHHHRQGGDDWSGYYCDAGGCWDQYGGYWKNEGGYVDEHGRLWQKDWEGYWDTDENSTYYEKEDNVDAVDDTKSWKDWFEKCGQIRIPPSIIATRRAASEAYWDFDRSLAVAEKAVDNALTAARLKGE